MALTQKKCLPCEGGIQPLTLKEYTLLLQQIKGWRVAENKLEKDFTFKNFKKALDFVNKAGKIAEQEGHHPDIYIHGWNKVRLTLYTHAIGGLSENDFIVAAKIDVVKA